MYLFVIYTRYSRISFERRKVYAKSSLVYHKQLSCFYANQDCLINKPFDFCIPIICSKMYPFKNITRNRSVKINSYTKEFLFITISITLLWIERQPRINISIIDRKISHLNVFKMRIDFRVTTNRRKSRSLASNPFRVYYEIDRN